MADINMNNILKKLKRYIESPSFQKRLGSKINEVVLSGTNSNSLHEAAGKFIEVMQHEIENAGAAGRLGQTAVEALSKLEHGTPISIGDNKYEIRIWFSGDLHRESLAPDRYDGVENIAALLNNGYRAKRSVYGVWQGHSDGKVIPSLPVREGAHFVENAIRDYMANYAGRYGVIDIQVGEDYK